MVTYDDIYRAWVNAGFLPEEAHELTYGSKGVEFNPLKVYNSKPAIRARRARMEWIRSLRAQGWTFEEIEREARAYYTRDTKRSPWDFIRVEYKPKRKKDFKEYREAARQRAKAEIKTLYRRQ